MTLHEKWRLYFTLVLFWQVLLGRFSKSLISNINPAKHVRNENNKNKFSPGFSPIRLLYWEQMISVCFTVLLSLNILLEILRFSTVFWNLRRTIKNFKIFRIFVEILRKIEYQSNGVKVDFALFSLFYIILVG